MRILKLLKNRYIIVLLVIGIYLVFFDAYSVGVQYRLLRELNHLESETERYQEEYKQDSIAYEALLRDNESIETYVRERLYMKRADEDIFLMEKPWEPEDPR